MSAFIVSDDCINRIVSFIFYDRNGLTNCAKKEIVEEYGEYKDLAHALIEMNVHAVNYRYLGEPSIREDKEDVQARFKEQYIKDKTVQVLKSLQCYLYQCTEGGVPNWKLYKQLREVEISIMHEIIDSMKEYQEAKWD